mgnify:CR=1 FL=1
MRHGHRADGVCGRGRNDAETGFGRCQGDLDVYAPRGTYQIVIRQIEPKGIGALELALRKLRERGHCVVFSSHVMQEVAELCDEIVVIAPRPPLDERNDTEIDFDPSKIVSGATKEDFIKISKDSLMLEL